MNHPITRNLAVAAAYLAVGRLALLLAIPPGYASGVWPSAGIALAAVLAYGRGVWPGVLLGSLLVNLSTGADFGGVSQTLNSLGVPLLIAAGATLQALVGAIGIRRFVGYPNALDDERSIGLFLVIGGPLACLVSASVGTVVLVSFGAIPGSESGWHWFTWWIGDTMGAVLFAPLLLVLIGEPRAAWRGRGLWLSAPLLASVLVIVGLFVYASHLVQARTRALLAERGRDIGHGLSRAVDGDVQVVRAMRALLSASEPVHRERFASFVRGYIEEDAGIQALEWVPRVLHEDRAAAEQAARAAGHPDFTFTERQGGKLVPAARRDEYYPVYYLEPRAPNESAFGFDLGSNSARRQALDAAAASGEVTATAPITLVQETGDQLGFLMLAPVFEGEETRGFVLAVFRAGDLLTSALEGLDHHDFELALNDVTDPARPMPLHAGQNAVVDQGLAPLETHYPFDVGSRRWEITFTPTAAYRRKLRSYDPWAMLVGGCAFSGLLGALLLLVTGRAGRVRRLVDQRTDEIRRSNEQLGALSSRLQGLLDCSLNFVIIAVDEAGKISLFNSGAERILGYSAEELVGKRSPRLLVVEEEVLARAAELSEEFGRSLTGVEAFLAIPRRDGYETREWKLVRKDGTTLPAELTVAPLMSGNALIGFFCVGSDITERKASERAMASARDQALELARTKSEFLANMSHEIRTPMNGVIGMAQLLERTRLDAEQRDYVDTVKKSSEALMAVINDILDFSKLEADKLTRETIPFDLRGVVEDAAAIMGVGARAKRLELVTDIDPNVAERVSGDPARLRQILLNLVGNAVKFTESGQVILRVSAAGSGSLVHFEIEDTGVGIEEAAAKQIFSPFSQEDASVTRKFGGTGLGLAITKRLVALLGGEIGVESRKGEGSRFWFTMPLPAAPPSTEEREVTDAALAGVRVLVVDDHDVNRAVLLGFLASWNIRAHEAPGGLEALRETRRAAARGEPYDILVVDIQMPGMSGLELIESLRAAPGGDVVRILVLTSTGADLRDRALQLGADLYLMKPLGRAAFRRALERLVGARTPGAPTVSSATGSTVPDAVAAVPSTAASATSAAGARRSILVAEDNAINQKVLGRMLEKLGFAVTIVDDGQAAVDAWAAGEFAAVLMDCQMPVLDGYSATERIRALEEPGAHTPIIAVTAHALEGERDRATAAGMDDYVAKPFALADIREALERHIPAPTAVPPAGADGQTTSG